MLYDPSEVIETLDNVPQDQRARWDRIIKCRCHLHGTGKWISERSFVRCRASQPTLIGEIGYHPKRVPPANVVPALAVIIPPLSRENSNTPPATNDFDDLPMEDFGGGDDENIDMPFDTLEEPEPEFSSESDRVEEGSEVDGGSEIDSVESADESSSDPGVDDSESEEEIDSDSEGNNNFDARVNNPSSSPAPDSSNYDPLPRALDDYEIFSLLLWDFITIHNITDNAWKMLRKLFKYKGVDVLSKQRLTSLAEKLSGLEIITTDVCRNFCISYGWFGTLDRCHICGELRYQEELVRGEKVAVKTQETYSLVPLIRALNANNSTSQQLKESYMITASAVEEKKHTVTDFHDSKLAKKLYRQQIINSPADVTLMVMSDGAELQQLRKQKVGAVFVGVQVLSLNLENRHLHKNGWSIAIIPKTGQKQDIKSFHRPYVEELKRLEERMPVYSAAMGKWEEGRVIVPIQGADTVEQCFLAGHVGAMGRVSCLTCLDQGITIGTTTYHPILAPTDRTGAFLGQDIETTVATTRSDDEPTKKLQIRSLANYNQTLIKLDKAISKKSKRTITLETGITGPSIYNDLDSYVQSFPWFHSLDSMHLIYPNVSGGVIKMLNGLASTARGEILSEDMVEEIGKNQILMNHFKPSSHGNAPRQMSKSYDYTAEEFRVVMTQDLPFLIEHFQSIPECVKEFISGLGRLIRMLNSGEIDYSQDPGNEDEDMTLESKNGKLVANYFTMQRSTDRIATAHNEIFYNRNRSYLKLSTPSFHRFLHLVEYCVQVGPIVVGSQWFFEGKIGDEGRHLRSQKEPIVNIQNQAKFGNIRFLIRLKFPQLEKLLDEEKKTDLITKEDYESKFAGPGLETDNIEELEPFERAGLEEWRNGEEGRLITDSYELSTIKRWNRCVLANGEELRSAAKEKSGRLPGGKFDFKEGKERKIDNSGRNRAARFAKCDDAAGTGFVVVEVKSFLELKFKQGQSIYFICCDQFPELVTIRGFGSAFDSEGLRLNRMIHFLAIRRVVGLQLIPAHTDRDQVLQPMRYAVTYRAGVDATPQRSLVLEEGEQEVGMEGES